MDIKPQVSASHQHALFLDDEGYVWQYGSSSLACSQSNESVNKILNLPHPISKAEASRYSSVYSMLLDENGVVWAAGQMGNIMWNDVEQIAIKTSIASISCGSAHCMFIDTDRKIWGLGSNEYNKLGLKSECIVATTPARVYNIPPMKKIECGCMQTVMLDEEGFVWVMGSGALGQLGFKEASAATNCLKKLDSQNLPKIKDISSYFLHTILLDVDGNVWGAGHNSYGELGLETVKQLQVFQIIFENHNVTHIATGYHTALCTVDGDVWTTGYNSYGQLGVGNTENVYSFTKVNDIPKIQRTYCGMYITFLEDDEGFFWRAGSVVLDGNNVSKFELLTTNFQLNRPRDRFSVTKSARKS